ncbi:MAG: hypothetical protein CML66_08020 [Rhodobacteraceae bacterium]|nr:hypothetical protein [Paracoccaceae bacterium]MAY45089.1 hypothetical protein [Paracoccaceae bacterium]QEW22574.1 hypothetical protein LA6_004806 [Marinibacterium anthonyi]|tara:strand:- start:281 stop:814 length:534 start_codon:yes stop_codon:yes gene_type:complete
MNPQRILRGIGLGLGLGLVLSACSGNDGLRQLNRPPRGPDEFKVLPSKPLQEPDSYTFLPAPTPGGANRTDPTPDADAVAALGGNAAAVRSTTVPGRDGTIVNYANRYGLTPNIRQELADEDAQFRRRQGRFTNIRLVPVDRYNQAYERYSLDPFAEADRFRNAGIRVPANPPEKAQ